MKIKFDDLPEGFEVRNGEIVEVKKTGGTTGDQKNYGLVTGPQDEYEHEEIKVKYSMSAVPRDEANIEAEGGETVLTDLNDDGNFGLYDIKGSRHANGGVPLYLPEQSFVFSDFNKMKLTKDEMKQMGVNSKKRLTPAKVSKKYGLNEYYASLKDPFADDIQAKSAELMLDKNKMQLSKLAFIQEAKKDFEEGVPVTAFPFLAETGYDPIEYTQQVEDITRQQAEQKYIESLPPEQQMQLQALQQYMAQVDEQEQEMIDANTEQGALPPPTNMGGQQGMMPPPPEMDNQQLAQMGFEVEDMSYAQGGTETKDERADSRVKTLMNYYDSKGYDVFNNTFISYLYDIAKRDDYNVIRSDEEIFKVTGQRPEGYVSKDIGSYSTSDAVRNKQEAKEFLDDPDGTNQSNTNVTTPSPKRNATATVLEEYTEEDDIPVAEEDPINKVFLGNTELLQNYRALERTFKDPSSPAAKALIEKFKEGIDNDDYFGKRVSKQDREKLNQLDDQQILDYFLMLEKRNLGAYAHELAGGKKISDYDQTGDANLGTDPELEKLFDQMGLSGQTSGLGGIAQQLSYIAYRDLLKERDAGNLTDAQSKALKGFGVSQVGKKDEAYNIDAENDISRADGYLTNTTTGEIASFKAPNEIPLAEKTTVPVEEATVEDEDNDINIQPNQLKVPYNPNDPRFWLQDLLKLNAIANRKRGKFYPWQPAVEDIEVDWVLEDPTRAIAAANEQMNIMAQGLGTFGGPQSFNARMSNIQGKNAANVANIIAGVHNRNVNTTNRGLAQQAQFDYYIDKENRARNTKLYDDTMKVEQNALIEENFDREQYADALANAYTNMANTYNMNTLYDNYNIDPTTGGMVYFTNPTALDPSPYSAKSKMDKYFDFGNEFRTKFKREPTEAEIKYFMGIQDDDNQMSNYQREARAKGMGSGYNRGYDYTGQRGREINKLLPFFTGQVGI